MTKRHGIAHPTGDRDPIVKTDRKECHMAPTQEEQAQAAPEETAAATPGQRIKGLTDSEFDGVSLPTLRAWKKFWSDEARGTDDALAETNEKLGVERTKEQHLEMITAEIDAREATRSQGGPNGGSTQS
jgi:hypothetical protein